MRIAPKRFLTTGVDDTRTSFGGGRKMAAPTVDCVEVALTERSENAIRVTMDAPRKNGVKFGRLHVQ